jgi:hypothetical protein
MMMQNAAAAQPDTFVCRNDIPEVAMKVSAYLDWIAAKQLLLP